MPFPQPARFCFNRRDSSCTFASSSYSRSRSKGAIMPSAPNRREFLATAAVAGTLATVPHVRAAGGDQIKVGLIGCGDRGTGAAAQALKADKNVKLVAMADAFERSEERRVGKRVSC